MKIAKSEFEFTQLFYPRITLLHLFEVHLMLFSLKQKLLVKTWLN